MSAEWLRKWKHALISVCSLATGEAFCRELGFPEGTGPIMGAGEPHYINASSLRMGAPQDSRIV